MSVTSSAIRGRVAAKRSWRRFAPSAGCIILTLLGGCAAQNAPAPRSAVAGYTPAALRSTRGFTPRYPPPLRLVGVQGGVFATFAVTSDGRVALDSTTIDSTTNRAFADSLRLHFAEIRFAPAHRAGRPVPSHLKVLFDFTLDRRCHDPLSRTRVTWIPETMPPTVRIASCVREIGEFDARQARAAHQLRMKRSPSQRLDSIATLFGLTPLFNPRSARDSVELRFWIGGGITLPEMFYRLVRTGHRVDGFIAGYWPRVNQFAQPGSKTTSDLMHAFEAGRCGPYHVLGNLEGCWMVFTAAPDWQRVWDSLVTLGVESLRDQILLPRAYMVIDDGWGMTVEVRRGARYRWYAYSNANDYDDQDDKRASAVAGALGMAARMLRAAP